ncbi:MAG: hypothetical protein M1832_000977 [Thelocarpon impressellum]|nr:MAG: hypothetical protein M1832_000977 [Thelocarpon impressellum]
MSDRSPTLPHDAPSRTPTSPTSLQPPTLSIDDPGAHDLQESSEDENDHFSDASEGHYSMKAAESGSISPVPFTRLEKIDSRPSYGETPGTEAYNKRVQDAVPDEVEVVARSRGHSRSSTRDEGHGVGPIPITVVEKIEPEKPSHGDVPGTEAHNKRLADAVPDQVLVASDPHRSPSEDAGPRVSPTPGDHPIPVTVVSRVDLKPAYGEEPGTDAYEMRKGDAEPDVLEEQGDVQESPTASLDRSASRSRSLEPPERGRPMSEYDEDEDGEGEGGDGFGDDFEEFEEGGGDEDDDFGDFDDGFPQPGRGEGEEEARSEQPAAQSHIPPLPLLNFDELHSPEEVAAAAEPYLRVLFPDAHAGDAAHVEPLPEKDSIFLTERSASLYAQLLAPPPLQPPQWLRSRTRRLFLVSLGVPVDLDEILPASKQKKLVLPSIHLPSSSRDPSPRPSGDHGGGGGGGGGSVARLKKSGINASSSSVSSGKGSKRKGPAPPPDIDLAAARAAASTLDATLSALSAPELDAHVARLEALSAAAGELLSYWLQRKDGAVGDKEAFEGVIENLVKHARKVRK